MRQRRLDAKKGYFVAFSNSYVDEEMYRKKLAEIVERARKRPMLIESDAQLRSQILQRRKTLQTVRDSLVSSGVDYKRFFNADELDELMEMDLEKKIRKE